MLLTTLTTGFVTRIEQNPAVPQRAKTSITDQAAQGIDIVSVEQVRQGARDAGLPPKQADAVADDYGNAQIDGLKVSLLAVAILAALGLWFTRRLPNKPLGAPV